MSKILFTIMAIQLLASPSKLFTQIVMVKETLLTENEFDDRHACYSPDGTQIIFESVRDGNWEIYLMDSNGKNQQRLTVNNIDDRRPSWHPNGKQILYESNSSGKNELYTLKLKNKKIKRISKQAYQGEIVFASFSPNGKVIALSLKESEDKSNIYLMNKKGKLTAQLTNGDKRTYYPKWSNDGKEIVFFSRKETDNKDDEIYKMDLAHKTAKRLTNWTKHNFCPAWSSDNRRIVYVTSMEGSRPEIYVMDANGENQTRITQNEDGETLPNWSPNSDKILVTGYRNGNYEICEFELKIDN